jgi:hypothetical protein
MMGYREFCYGTNTSLYGKEQYIISIAENQALALDG